jgi:hypothetical protein
MWCFKMGLVFCYDNLLYFMPGRVLRERNLSGAE